MCFKQTVVNLLIILCFCHYASAEQGGFEWEKASPETQGMSSQKLDAARDVLSRKGTKTFLVIKNDKIIFAFLDEFKDL